MQQNHKQVERQSQRNQSLDEPVAANARVLSPNGPTRREGPRPRMIAEVQAGGGLLHRRPYVDAIMAALVSAFAHGYEKRRIINQNDAYRIAPPPPPRCVFRIPIRLQRWIMAAVIIAPLAACFGGEPTPAPTAAPAIAPTPTQVPALAPTATPRTGLLLSAPESFEGYTLVTQRAVGRAYLIDNQGQTVHIYGAKKSLAKLLDNGNILTEDNTEFDSDGNVVWEFRFLQHHDLLKLPNGNVLILSRATVTNEEAVALGANPDSLSCSVGVRGTRVVEARPTGPESAEIVWEWSAFDHLIQDFDPEKPNYGVVADHPERIDLNFALADAACVPKGADWHHANALDYNAELDQIMITVRHFSEIWIIDRSVSKEEAGGSAGRERGQGGDLLYRWGNPRAYRAGTPADQRLFFPHSGHWIPEGSPGAGNVLIFNNGVEYPGFERGYSSVDEVALPANGPNYRRDARGAYQPAEAIWAYVDDPPGAFYVQSESSAQRLPNGNTLITDGPAGRIFEVTREGKTVWDFETPAPELGPLYRAYRYPPHHLAFQGLDLTPHRTTYRDARAGEPLARAAFDLYAADGYLVYAKEQCEQDDLEHLFYLHIIPESVDDLPESRRRHGFDSLAFDFFLRGALFDGECAARIPLPDYSVASIRTGQQALDGSVLWSARLSLNPETYRTAYVEAVVGEPLARSTFDLYAADGALVYVKEQCEQDDITHRFFLHIVPERPNDLPEARREVGFENLDFEFFFRGALFDGRCAARVPLPDYPVASIRTGQFGSGGELWSVDVAFPSTRR